MSDPAIRPLATIAEYRACVALQEEVWGAGFSERVSLAILKVSQRLGGVAAGAWDDEGRLAGFVFGMTGLEDGIPVHWSDMLAVRPEHRNGGLGTRLKAYQRTRMLELGVHRIYWTFDPLESKNAYLNFAKLGIVAREYAPNMYGEVTDSPLHQGIGTDRLVALWLIDSERVRSRLGGTGPPPGSRALEGARELLAVAWEDGDPVPEDAPSRAELPRAEEGGGVVVPIPGDIQGLKDRRPELAARWRERTRALFTGLLARGWEVRELVPGGGLSRYLLEPGSPGEGEAGDGRAGESAVASGREAP